MENVRFNISPCSQKEAADFIGKIDKSAYLPRGVVNADERSHYDRYAFLRDESKVAVVYDTSANVISITAPENFATELLALFDVDGRVVKRSTVPAQNSVKREAQNRPSFDGASPETRSKLFFSPDRIRRRPQITPTTVVMTAKGDELSTDEIFPPQRAKPRNIDNNDAPSAVNNATGSVDGNGDGTFRADGLEPPPPRGYERVRERTVRTAPQYVGNYNYGRDGVHVNASMPERQKASSVDEYFMRTANRAPAAPISRTADVPKRATISFGDYDEEKGKTLPERPMSGGTGLYADIASRTSFASPVQSVQPTQAVGEPQAKRKRGRPRKDTATADIVMPPEVREKVQQRSGGQGEQNKPRDGGRADGSGKRFPNDRVATMLKKRLPTAYEYLSEQSRVDFSYGLNDFSQNKLMLSDYSVLLVPPFRGLEKFIFDLQAAEGIKVKMIGQAFDKDDGGNYILKRGYCQRIGSVIYAEVMVALYTEYFSRRNFFAHSDNTDDNRSRAITDKAAAKAIFDRLLEVVEYNAKKLKEIGFSMSADDGK